jgi:alpha-amylase
LLHAVVDAAHQHGIKMIMDAVINHPGPVTPADPAWPDAWVRTKPQCTYKTYATTTECTLVPTLPDVRTDSDTPVELPPALTEKWQQEGRLDQEKASLDAFFSRTGYPRAPRYYVIKWLTDWVREFGFDGYRVDTAKHFGESVSGELKKQADIAYADWKAAHASELRQSLPFYMVGEVYGYWLGAGRLFDYGDRTVDFFSHGYDGLINFAFKAEVAGSLDSVFTRYSSALGPNGPHNGVTVLNYLSSHDDGGPYDPDRKDPFGAANRLLLAPGTAQIYYGDETARPLKVNGAEGDANLRSLMNWGDLKPGSNSAAILKHWRILGRFRQAHPAIGAGEHHTLQAAPFIFSRTLEADGRQDRVLVAMDQVKGAKTIPVFDFFTEGTEVVDEYSGTSVTVTNGSVTLNTPSDLVLLSEPGH